MVGNGNGYRVLSRNLRYGDGDGNGYLFGGEDGNSYGWDEDGGGYGDGYGEGDGYGDSFGYGYGLGDGVCYGEGDGDGYGYGYRRGYGVNPNKENKMIQIVVADQGWVFVGIVSDGKSTLNEEGVLMENAKCIRVWGTSWGLGQLINGPTENTILDPMGCVKVKSVLFTMKVNQDAWKPVIGEQEGS